MMKMEMSLFVLKIGKAMEKSNKWLCFESTFKSEYEKYPC